MIFDLNYRSKFKHCITGAYRKMKRQFILTCIILLGSCSLVCAQIRAYYGPDSAELAAFKKDSARVVALRAGISLEKARPYPLPEPNVKEIKFYHRYWRDIDLSNPQNKVMAQPGATLIEATLAALKKGVITAYDPTPGTPENPTGDAFTLPINYALVMSQLSDSATVDQFDKDGNKIGSIQKANNFTPDKISGYRIKEDVYFDKTRSRVMTRIIGIAPLLKLSLSNGDSLGVQPLCWFNFNQFRKVLVTMAVDTANKKAAMSMDDIFLQRRFASRIVEESNPLGVRIKDYASLPADQEKEARRIEQKLTAYKGSMWPYSTVEIEDETNGTADAKTDRVQKNTKKISAPTGAANAPTKVN